MRDSGIRFVGYANLISIAPGEDGRGGGERGFSVFEGACAGTNLNFLVRTSTKKVRTRKIKMAICKEFTDT